MALAVQFNRKSENPFYGMSNTLELTQTATKRPPTKGELDAAWKEADTKEKKAVLFSILFEVGDVPRQHAMFDTKVDNGGAAERVIFRDHILPWMWTKVKRMSAKNKEQFLWLVYQYTNLENLVGNRVRTKKKTSDIIQVIKMTEIYGVATVAKFCARLYRSRNINDRMALSKFLSLPKSRPTMQDKTKESHLRKSELLKTFCDLVNLPYAELEDGEGHSYINFTGYRAWRKQYNQKSEAVLFSTGHIKDMDKEQFFQFLQACPSDARGRVKMRLKNTEKWSKLSTWFNEYETIKLEAQDEQRKLEEKVRQGFATQKDKERLVQVKKTGKVNTGATTLKSIIMEFFAGLVKDKTKVQTVLDNVDFPYNTLVIVDKSGSMRSTWRRPLQVDGKSIIPIDFAAAWATLALLKNPDDSARNFLGLFAGGFEAYNAIDLVTRRPNRLTSAPSKKVNKPLVDPTKDFLTNMRTMREFMDANADGGTTNVAAIAKYMIDWIHTDPSAIDVLQQYPVWTLISDGEFNNRSNVAASLGEMFKLMDNKVGFRPVVLLIDVADATSAKITNFEGVDNMFMVPPNAECLAQIITNIRDLDTLDIYTPLQTKFRSNRYAPIRQLFGVNTSATKKKAKAVPAV